MRTKQRKLFLFIAIDRTSTLAFARLVEKANTATAVAFLNELVEAIPYKIDVVLTDNGIQFADLPKRRGIASQSLLPRLEKVLRPARVVLTTAYAARCGRSLA